MNKIEILAPAGGFDSVIAAVRSGADAVYLGAKEFSARASAHNFDDDELRECVRYCHQRGVKAHLALNTVIFDDELPRALELAKKAAKADIDAIIIQDWGLAGLIKRAIPELPLHASTQMSVHTPYGAKALYERGFERVVLARELSLDEIKMIRESCPEVELEVFVHGALCMCVSGQCYFSAMLGGRSANRGMCAQPCRLPTRFGEDEYALSLKDNGSLNHLRELQSIGVASAKIEGRMKRPEYVAAATAAAVEARDHGKMSIESEERLRSVFSRSGFTDGYLRARLGEDMFGHRRRDDVVSADSKLLKDIRNEYKDERQNIGLSLNLRVRAGERPELTVTDGKNTVVVEGEPAEIAVKAPLTAERAAASLKKTGGTQYHITDADIQTDGKAALSAAALNALRREALGSLDEKRAVWHEYIINETETEASLAESAKSAENRVCVTAADYPPELGELGQVYVALEAVSDEDISSGRIKRIIAPRVCFGTEAEVYDKLKKLRENGATDLIAHNIAFVYIGRELGYNVHAGFGLNIANSISLEVMSEMGVADAELSPEIDLRRIEKLKKIIPVGIVRYGYMPLMITRNAPAGSNRSCKYDEFLQDRKGESFRVIRRTGYCEIMNSVPVLMPQKDYKLSDEVFSVFHFSVENSVENMKKILEKLRENRTFERITHGLYIRGVK